MFAAILAMSVLGNGGGPAVVGFGGPGGYGSYVNYGYYAPYASYAPYACYGCYSCGGCYGCGCHVPYEPYVSFLCHGCYGCHSCFSCYGCSACSGCYGCSGCFNGCWSFSSPDCYTLVPVAPYVVIPGCNGAGGPSDSTTKKDEKSLKSTEMEIQNLKATISQVKQSGKDVTVLQAKLTKLQVELDTLKKLGKRALISVSLPAGAKLYLDGNPTNSQGKKQRSIITPDLEAGSKYFYVLRAEFTADGKTHQETKRVSFQAGRLVRVEFGELLKLESTKPFLTTSN